MDGLPCSDASLRAAEPLAGTAVDSVDHWLLLEVTDVWAPKVLQTEALSGVRSVLSDWSERPRSRLQLIRRPGRSADKPLLISVASGRESRVELDRYEDLLDLDLDAIGPQQASPSYLVCVHGRRDRCCARHGSAVYRALRSCGAEIWQTSHLGGHRFAACVLSLPDGLMYGRLRPEEMDRFVRAKAAGEVGDLERLRGRCAFDQPTQSAEIFLRRRTGEAAAEAFEWVDTTPDGQHAWISRFRSSAGEHLVRVRVEGTDRYRPPSCGADPEPVTQFVEG